LIIVTDWGVRFINDAIKYLTDHFLLKHASSTTYYPQENGQAGSINKVFGTLLTKPISENKKNWDEHLFTMLFSYKIANKLATWYIPYQLVHGLHPLMSIEYIVLVVGGNETNNIPMKVFINRIIKLEKLQDVRMYAIKIIGIQ